MHKFCTAELGCGLAIGCTMVWESATCCSSRGVPCRAQLLTLILKHKSKHDVPESQARPYVLDIRAEPSRQQQAGSAVHWWGGLLCLVTWWNDVTRSTCRLWLESMSTSAYVALTEAHPLQVPGCPGCHLLILCPLVCQKCYTQLRGSKYFNSKLTCSARAAWRCRCGDLPVPPLQCCGITAGVWSRSTLAVMWSVTREHRTNSAYASAQQSMTAAYRSQKQLTQHSATRH
jgi:hypothetical protein